MEIEIWKPVVGWETRYHVSSFGRIKSLNHDYININGKRHRHSEKIKKPQNKGNGYFMIWFPDGCQLIHRVVACAFLPNLNNLPFVNHKDGNKKNNYIDNLEWCTRQENEDHAFRTGLKNSTGSANQMAKLTEQMVEEIKLLYSAGKKYTEISKIYNVHRMTISRIINGHTWSHV